MKPAEVSEVSESWRSTEWGSGGSAPSGGRVPDGVRGSLRFFVFKTLIFNAAAIALHEMTYGLSCFFCAHVYGFTIYENTHVKFEVLSFNRFRAIGI